MFTAQQIVDAARTRHWSFADLQVGDGAALRFLNTRQRVQLAQHGAKIEGIVGTSMTYAIQTVAGLLVAYLNGVPTFSTTYQDGWPVHVTGGGVPYIDTSEAPVAQDPFGAHGGTPGFPLPTDYVRMIAVALVYNSSPGLQLPCDVITEEQRFSWLPGRNPAAFVSGNRLVPLMPNSGANNNTGDRWFNVTSLQMSYVAVQALTSLADVLRLPEVLCEALIADLAVFFGLQSPKADTADKAAFAEEAKERRITIDAAALDMLNTPVQESVLYRG